MPIEAGRDKTKHEGNFTAAYDTQRGITFFAEEDIGGQIDHNPVVGVNAAIDYNHNFEWDTDHFMLFPLNLYIDFDFETGRRKSLYSSKNGLVFRMGYMDTLPGYGTQYPMLGGGCEVHFETPKSRDDVAFFGKLMVGAGGFGAIDAGQEQMDEFDSVTDGVGLGFIGTTLGLKFGEDSQTKLSLDGGFGYLSKDDDYLNPRWEYLYETPDTFDKYFGISPRLELNFDRFHMRAAYYYMGMRGEYSFDFFGVTESMSRNSHRLSGDIAFKVLKERDLSLSLGARANYYTSDREDELSTYNPNADWNWVLGGVTSDRSTWNDNRTYANAYFNLRYDFFKFEIGGGYMKGAEKIDINEDFTMFDEESEKKNWNLYLATTFSWGGDED